MATMNFCLLIGRMVRDPELRYTPAGVPLCHFTIALDRPANQATGEIRDADFIDCSAFRQNAEFAANYLTKGRLVGVQGQLHVRKYQAKDGSSRRSYEIDVSSLQALDGVPKEHRAPDEPSPSPQHEDRNGKP